MRLRPVLISAVISIPGVSARRYTQVEVAERRGRKSRLHSMSCGSPCKLGRFRVYSRLLDERIGDRIDALGSNGV